MKVNTNTINSNNTRMAIVVAITLALTACSTERVVDNTVDATGFVAKTAVKGVVGVGKLGVKGVKKVAGAE